MKAISGLYAVTPDLADTAMLLAQTGAALAGGVKLVQYRSKTAANNLRYEQAEALRALCRRHDAALIVNDHVALAYEVDADGVHVGTDDESVAAARARLGRGKIIGASCYNSLDRALAAAAQGADYVAFGSFYPSVVKPGAARAPLSVLSAARQRIPLPVVAIGGITLDNAGELIAEGVSAVAIISALFGAPDIEIAARAFCRLFQGETA